MRAVWLSAIVVMVTLAVLPPCALAAGEHPIVVRTYDSAQLPEHERALAVDAAGAILETAGVTVAWASCGALTAGVDHACDARLAPNELAIRFVLEAPESRTNAVVLGDSLIDRHTTFAALATIYLGPIERLAAACHVPWTTVLGRAVAHEIGHLLLGSTRHSSTGLMRAIWPRRALEQNDDVDFLFTVDEATALQRAADLRSAQTRRAPGVWSTE